MSYCEHGQRITEIAHCAYCYATLRQRAEKAEARVAELEAKLDGATTMMACKGCGIGVRPRYAVAGLCAACARGWLSWRGNVPRYCGC